MSGLEWQEWAVGRGEWQRVDTYLSTGLVGTELGTSQADVVKWDASNPEARARDLSAAGGIEVLDRDLGLSARHD